MEMAVSNLHVSAQKMISEGAKRQQDSEFAAACRIEPVLGIR